MPQLKPCIADRDEDLRVGAETIRYELTIDDPMMWTGRGLRSILSGSRADEAAARKP